jgi:transposase
MVVDIYGFVKYCDLYPGNISEPKTLSDIIGRIEKKLSSENKPLVVIDAGISTEGNLQLLRERGYDYISVSRQRLKEYQAIDEQPCVIRDKKGNKIELKKIAVDGKPDCYLGSFVIRVDEF